jgi:hypothetical protein
MTPKKPIDAKELLEMAKKNVDKESYRVMHKTQVYRIGVGARAALPDVTFFIEVIVNMSNESKKVDVAKLENILNILRILQIKDYSLTYEGDNYIQCETTRASQDLNEEYLSIKLLLKKQLG